MSPSSPSLNLSVLRGPYTVLRLVILIVFGVAMGTNSHAEQLVSPEPAVIKDSVVLPAREIHYKENGVAPDWKQGWDKARELFRQQKFGEAFIQYELLLAQKDNIDEARWEYAVIAIHLKKWNRAAQQLDILITHDPNNLKYLFTRADLYLTVLDYESAANLFEKLLSLAQNDEERVHALEGLIDVAEQTEKIDQLVLQRLEILLSMKPDDEDLRKKCVKTALFLGLPEKALFFIGDYLPTDDNPEILKLRAVIADKMGDLDKGLEYRLRYVELVGNDPEVYHQLETYYQRRKNYIKALECVETLISLEPENSANFLSAADLNRMVGRVDKSLEYYSKYLLLVPGDTEVIEKKQRALHAMASDLLVLVENDGGRLLWRDLVKVTDDRLTIYKIMADLLRERGKTEELINVLTIIHEEDPGDTGVSDEITRLLGKRESTDQPLERLSEPTGGDVEQRGEGAWDGSSPLPEP